MRGTTHTNRPGRPRALVLAATALLSGVLVAGCGGSSPSPTSASTAADAGARTTTGSTIATPGGTTSSGWTAPSAYRSGPLGFAECMRANGVPNFPDPQPGGGGFSFPTSAGFIGSPASRAAQAKCGKLLPGGGGPLSPGPPASAQAMAQLRKVAVCMRSHGVPQFPDPRASAPSNVHLGDYSEITNYEGAILLFPATIDMQSPAWEQAAAACGPLAESFNHPHH